MYYRELGIEQLGYACLVLRKRADGGGLDGAAAPAARGPSPGRAARAKLFETHDRLAELDSDDGLLPRRLRVVDDAVVTQETRFAGGRWHSDSLTLRLEAGLPFSAELDSGTARLVRELDGSRLSVTRWRPLQTENRLRRLVPTLLATCWPSASSTSPTEASAVGPSQGVQPPESGSPSCSPKRSSSSGTVSGCISRP